MGSLQLSPARAPFAVPSAEAWRPARPARRLGALLAVLIAVGVGAFGYQFAIGLVVSGMRNIVVSATFPVLHVLRRPLGQRLIVASTGAGGYLGQAFKPHHRLAVFEATVAVVLAATFILPDLGRPERVLNVPSFQPVVPHGLGHHDRDGLHGAVGHLRLAVRTGGPRATRVMAVRDGDLGADDGPRGACESAMAWIALPAAILLHSITAWIFGLQIGRRFSYSSVVAPSFVTSTLVSGLTS